MNRGKISEAEGRNFRDSGKNVWAQGSPGKNIKLV